jgi:hypothetical protein
MGYHFRTMPFWSSKKRSDLGETQRKSRMVASAFLEEMLPNLSQARVRLADEANKQLDANTIETLELEDVWLVLHLFDRAMFLECGPEMRKVFMDDIYPIVRNELARKKFVTPEINKIFRETFDEHYNARQKEYGAYKMFPEKDGPLGQTLFWEYAKKMMATTEWTNPALMQLIMLQGLGYFDVVHGLVRDVFSDTRT